MSQTVNPVKNPSCEVNATGYYALSGTGGASTVARATVAPAGPGAGSAYARSTWTVANTAIGAGMTIGSSTLTGVERIDVVPGQLYQIGVWVRASVAKTLKLTAVVYSASATLVSSSDGPNTVVAANTWTRLTIANTPGAGGVRLVLLIEDFAAPFWANGNTLDVDGVIVWPGATLPDYSDPSTNPNMGWSGTAHASTSILFTPTVTLTQYAPDTLAGPRVEVLVQDLPPGTITITRFSDARSFPVRGGVKVASASGVTVLDVEVPEGITAGYQAQMFAPDGTPIGFSTTTATTMPITGIYISQPLDPTLFAKVNMDDDSAASLVRGFDGAVVYTDGATVGRWVGGRRKGLSGVILNMETSTVADADEIQSMFGTYSTDQLPVLCIRTPPGFGRIPRTLFLAVQDPEEIDRSVRFGGSLVAFALKGDEVLPPAPGLSKSLLRYNDTDLFYPTYSAIDAAYGTYLARDRDYSKAGYAP
ncbi:hypothetical protein [Cryobacterium fucosi]|uniref:CBM-cenC domain-containing protein n=1 Tax=Cryobacterium fucosi TaxID=1259157 RepID=A0A4R9B2T9_9MICO|nr:hypothetical protein [Cryobacterium fucosi]TFD74738.1 hypothetical protein E3T48_12495 [Cryobacterium fucosi]